MREAAKFIIDSGHFAGDGFSEGDQEIMSIVSEKRKAGKPSDWRAIAATHHWTRCVTDLGPYHGYTIPRLESTEPDTQTLFDREW